MVYNKGLHFIPRTIDMEIYKKPIQLHRYVINQVRRNRYCLCFRLELLLLLFDGFDLMVPGNDNNYVLQSIIVFYMFELACGY